MGGLDGRWLRAAEEEVMALLRWATINTRNTEQGAPLVPQRTLPCSLLAARLLQARLPSRTAQLLRNLPLYAFDQAFEQTLASLCLLYHITSDLLSDIRTRRTDRRMGFFALFSLHSMIPFCFYKELFWMARPVTTG